MDELILPASRRNATLGADTLIYFERLSDGHLIIPPVARAQTPKGYVRMEADSLRKLEQVSKRFEAQKRREFALVDEKFARKLEAKMSEIRGRLNHRRANTRSQREKDIIGYVLQKLENDERAIRYRKIEGHLHIEEHESR